MAVISCQSDLLLTDSKQVLQFAILTCPGKFLCFHQKGCFIVNTFIKFIKPLSIESSIFEESVFAAQPAVAPLLWYFLVNPKLLLVCLWLLIALANQSMKFLFGH